VVIFKGIPLAIYQ